MAKNLTKSNVNYENQAPRCYFCRHFKRPFIKVTTNSQTVRINPGCKLLRCYVNENGLCDKWVSRKDGSTLEPLEPKNDQKHH